MGDPDGHDAPERVDSPYPRPEVPEVPLINGYRLTAAVGLVVAYPFLAMVLGMIDESVSVATIVIMPFVIAYYCARAFRLWPYRILGFVLTLLVCWPITDNFLTLYAQNR